MDSIREGNWRSASAEDVPAELASLTVNEKYAIPYAELAAAQLEALKARLASVAPRIPVVKKLAAEQGIASIDQIADIAPLLLRNSTYKSYPLRVIETGRFDQLTKWLDKLTVHDLSSLDMADCRSIDDWIDRVAANTDIRLIHSSGTSGKLSFLPRSKREIALNVETFRHVGEGFGEEPWAGAIEDIAEMPLIFPSFRRGATEASRLQDGLVELLYGGDEGMIVALDEGRMSADALSLFGRINKGGLDVNKLRESTPPEVLERFNALRVAQANADEQMKIFLTEKLTALKGRKVVFFGSLGMFYDTAMEGERQGISGLFASDSVIAVGGGTKGRDFPPDAMEVIGRFLGVDRVRAIYGMSECIALSYDCPEGHFHVQPWIVPFLLDPLSGVPYPRTGTQKGHLGLFDLLPTTYWGGYLTGDEVTLSWGDTEPCACGRIGPYVRPDIRRYSEQEGGDDKITCAGAPSAHNRAIEFITNFEAVPSDAVLATGPDRS